MKADEIIAGMPCEPGVYIFKDSSGRIVYVGKAKRLRDRVKSHFRESGDARHEAMMSGVRSVDYIVTESEVDALILEANLVRDRQPRYNVTLKDDKRYPYLKVTVREDYPRLVLTRRVEKDGARYFGPHTDVRSLRKTMKLLRRVFPLRTCGDLEARQRLRKDCLSLHVNRCSGPCLHKVSVEEYRAVVDDLLLFLAGRTSKLLSSLRRDMERAAAGREYEKCALLRDRIAALERFTSGRKIVELADAELDVLGLERVDGEACVVILKVRGGKVIDQERRFLKHAGSASSGEILTSFVEQRYMSGDQVPPAIALPEAPEGEGLLVHWLGRLRGSRVEVRVPRRGTYKRLVEMACRNAAVSLEGREGRGPEEPDASLEELQRALDLESLPYVVDCYDISNTSGTNAVGSRVVFVGGRPDKGAYRRYKIRGDARPNDTAMLGEVVERSLSRRVLEGEEAPDLLVVDGGRGQVSAALEALGRVGLETVPVVGLAKAKELVYVRGRDRPLALGRDSLALRLLQRIRDEAHRFAISHHRRRRSSAQLKTILDGVAGLGPRRRSTLIREFGSAAAVAAAPESEIAALPGFGAVTARRVKDALRDTRKGAHDA